MNRANLAFLMFLVGLGSFTKVVLVGSIAITELVFFAILPYILLKDFSKLKHDGFLPVLTLLVLTMMGSALATYVNGAPIFRSIKVMAQYFSLFTVIVCMHRLLLRDPSSLKWFLLGAFFSGLITIFAFNASVQVSGSGNIGVEKQSVDDVLNGAMFWMFHLQNLLNATVGGFYYALPYLVSVCAPILAIVIVALTGVSGRAMSLCLVAAFGLFAYCGKSVRKMKVITKHFMILALAGIMTLIIFKTIYSNLAKSGVLGVEAQGKYLSQTRSGDSILRLLMSGRVEFFIGMRAALDKPIIGYGIYPRDTKGYIQEYYAKYGDELDMKLYLQSLVRNGAYIEQVIPTHSYMAGSWVFCGIFGLLLWLYVLYLCYMFFKKWIVAVPLWFGYYALGIPMLVWDIFFSPITNRISPAVMITALLLAKGVYERRIVLPFCVEDIRRVNIANV